MKHSVGFLFYLLMVGSSAARGDVDTDLFHPTPAQMTHTKYAGDCGGVSKDLAPEMPPIDNQKNAPWCAIYASKAVLDYVFHTTHPGDHYQNRLSPMDLNELSTLRPAAMRGKLPDMEGAEAALTILEGAQAAGAVYRTQDFPMDDRYFDPGGILTTLSDYYEREKPFLGASDFSCRPQSSETRALESLFSSLIQIARTSSDEPTFVNTMNARNALIPTPRPGAQRMKITPPFNIRDFYSNKGDEIMEEIQANLKANRPSVTQVCGYQMLQMPNLSSGLPVAPQFAHDCGSHSVDVVGMRVVHGSCQIELRSSSGTDWPQPGPGGGYGWITAENFLKIMNTTQGNAEIASISTRPAGTPVENSIKFTDYSYVGQTFQGQPQGQGSMALIDGTSEIGTFSGGQFLQGTYNGVYDATKGLYYKGPFLNGLGTVDGKFTDKNGNPANY